MGFAVCATGCQVDEDVPQNLAGLGERDLGFGGRDEDSVQVGVQLVQVAEADGRQGVEGMREAVIAISSRQFVIPVEDECCIEHSVSAVHHVVVHGEHHACRV